MFLLLCASLCPRGASALPNSNQSQPEFVPVLTEYLNHLAAGEYDAAVEMADLNGLVAHLTEQRIAVLKMQDPDMTPEEEAATRAALREKELHRDNIRNVLMQVIEELDPKGITWQITNAYGSSQNPNAVIVECRLTKPSGQQTSLNVGLLKVGPRWYIAPQLLEMSRRSAPPASRKEVVPPESVVILGDTFWGHWQSGALDEAYATASEAMRQKVPLLKYLETSQAVIEQIGALESWKIVSCAELAPDKLQVLYELQCTKRTVRAVLAFVKTGDSWEIAAIVIPYVGP